MRHWYSPLSKEEQTALTGVPTGHAECSASPCDVQPINVWCGARSSRRWVTAGEFNTPMPWQAYAGMTDDDLGAIYAYLRTLPAVDHTVEKVGYLQANKATP